MDVFDAEIGEIAGLAQQLLVDVVDGVQPLKGSHRQFGGAALHELLLEEAAHGHAPQAGARESRPGPGPGGRKEEDLQTNKQTNKEYS